MNNEEKNKENLNVENEENIVENGNGKEEIKSNLDAIKEEMEEDKQQDYKALYEDKMKEIEEVNNRFIRLQADFTNYKKRVEKEKENIYTYATEEIIKQLLPVIDNMERALDAVAENKEDDSFYNGVRMVYNQFLDILKKNGLEEIQALGKKFDPNLHHGVAQEESDEHDEDTVIDVFQKGYKLKDRVIRPSMVKIAK